MWYTRKDERTERERYLEDELEEMRDRERRAREQEQQAYERRMQDIRERIDESNRHAESWPEALRKQASLFWSEQHKFPEFDDDKFFEYSAQACERALELWNEVAPTRQAEIDELNARLAAIQDEIRLTVADKLEADQPDVGEYALVASAMRTEDYNNWLYW